MNWLSRSHDNRKLRRSRLVSLPADVYAGRILAAKLSAIDDVARALGVEPTEAEAKDALSKSLAGPVVRDGESVL